MTSRTLIKRSFVFSTTAAALLAASAAFGQRFAMPIGPITATNSLQAAGTGSSGFFEGIDLSAFLGANVFHSNGYTGTRAIVATIEGGYANPTHSTMLNLSTYVTGAGALAPGVSTYRDHATQTAFIAAGRDNFADNIGKGIAYGAELWSGSVATALGGGGSFNISTSSVASAYSAAMQPGRADVVNSSWGFLVTPANAAAPTASEISSQRIITAGVTAEAIVTDAVINATRKLHVIAAGNNGDRAGNFGRVSGIGSGYNGLVVGSTGSNPNYDRISNFSARGLSPYYDPNTGTFIENARARVDIVAPGEEIVAPLASWSPDAFTAPSGTSFAAPIVAGVGTLMADVAKDRFGTPESTDGRVLAAVMMNSADKLAGWNNQQVLSAGVINTTQALDATFGAGQVNGGRAFAQFTSGTTDVAGLNGGAVQAVGWDFGRVATASSQDYLITPTLLAGSTLTATLRWNAGASYAVSGGTVTSSFLDYLANLSLEVHRVNIGGGSSLIASSTALYTTTEHLHFTLTDTAQYFMRVSHTNWNYNFTGQTGENFALAWHSTPVPEPASIAALGLGALALLRRRRNRSA